MSIVVFVFGLPGSGKSAATRHIELFARQNNFHPLRFSDYPVLYKMFQDEIEAKKEPKRFRSTQYSGYDGFDILDFAVFDEVLQKLHHNIALRKKLTHESTEILLIEFSRDAYCPALFFFPSLQLRSAYFLFITSDIDTCKARIKARADHPRSQDDRYVSDYIFDVYYQRDHQHYTTEEALQLHQRFGVPREHIYLINNGPETSVEEFYQAVESLINVILKIEV